MSTVTVKTQAELDAALAGGATCIDIRSESGVRLYLFSTDSSTVTARGSSTVTACGSSTVTARGSSTVTAWGSSTVTAWDSSTVTAWDSSTVTACDSSTVTAWGSSTVTASKYAAVHLVSSRATINGGVLIDLTQVDLSTAQDWCDYHGVEVIDGIATLYKAVDESWTTTHGVNYSPGSTPAAPDWSPTAHSSHGLHFSPHPRQSRGYFPDATRYLSVGVAVSDLVPLGNDKAKAPRVVRACVEVDINGELVTPC